MLLGARRGLRSQAIPPTHQPRWHDLQLVSPLVEILGLTERKTTTAKGAKDAKVGRWMEFSARARAGSPRRKKVTGVYAYPPRQGRIADQTNCPGALMAALRLPASLRFALISQIPK